MAVNPVCDACKRGKHVECADIPIAKDRHTGDALTMKAGFVECRCICDPEQQRILAALDRAKAYVEAGEINMAMKAVVSAKNLLLLARLREASVKNTKCKPCGGSGMMAVQPQTECPACAGSGEEKKNAG